MPIVATAVARTYTKPYKQDILLRFVQLSDERVQKMYEVLDVHKSTYLAAFKDIYADVEAGILDRCGDNLLLHSTFLSLVYCSSAK